MKTTNHFKTKLPFFVFIAASLEYFDYLLFPILAATLMQVFFPGGKNTALINFLFFSLAGVVKFIGGIFFGFLSDLYGRKSIIQALALCMVVGTLCIGLMPLGLSETTYLVLLMFLRSLQGLSFGAEMTTASTYAYETDLLSKTKKLGMVFIGATLGAIAATSMLSLLSTVIPKSTFIAWGWRVPFILGSILGVVSFISRKNLKESHESRGKNTLHVIKKELKFHKSKILWALVVSLFPITLINVILYFPYYLNHYYQEPLAKIYFAQTLSLIGSVIFIYLASKIADRSSKTVSRLYVYLLFSFIGLIPFLIFIQTSYLYVFMIIWQFFISFCIIYGMKEMLSVFPKEARSTVSGFVYNLNFILASLIPVIFSKLTFSKENPYLLYAFILPIALAAIIGTKKIEHEVCES